MGTEDGTFYAIHGVALSCIYVSLICVILVLILSFYKNPNSFYTWNKNDKFIVYLVICDGAFNLVHMCDHLQIAATRDHVRPIQLCIFYAVLLIEFVYCQSLLVLFIAVNAFVLVRCQRNIELGRKDWKLIVGILTCSFVPVIIALSVDSLGPTGAFCGVQDKVANLALTIVPLMLIVPLNCLLYIVTWYNIRKAARRIRDVVGGNAQSIRASNDSAKIMTTFILAFLVQWWGMGVYGFAEYFGNDDMVFYMFIVSFTNLGGLFNGIVFLIMRRVRGVRKQRKEDKKEVIQTEMTKIE
ncbi:hypothetical protein FSP39_013533 [Pinctada imbricata]|uniref:G-protein coupled receptors family 1 profile domain-containing protein n=1 Tax=Pinctada imbricata TaxID=66713 RepID=A0AA88Y6U2_PINIB|nr:hypothetical protein FSP39_013533 [Pinctada imbricata]